MSVQDLINAAFSKNGSKFEETFDAVMREKVSMAVEAKLAAIAETDDENTEEDAEDAEDDSEDDE